VMPKSYLTTNEFIHFGITYKTKVQGFLPFSAISLALIIP